jgi:hypothetical protein
MLYLVERTVARAAGEIELRADWVITTIGGHPTQGGDFSDSVGGVSPEHQVAHHRVDHGEDDGGEEGGAEAGDLEARYHRGGEP